MKRMSIIIVTVVILYSCKSGTKARETGEPHAVSGRWPDEEQVKFLEDCNREFSTAVDSSRLKDFCSCMLSEAAKYYTSYGEMNANNNKKEDSKLYASCLEKYSGDSLTARPSN